jgi:hypothetical protein
MSPGALAALVAIATGLLSCIGTLCLLILNDMRAQIRTNTRHLEGMLSSLWILTMRVNSMEDHLTEQDGYRPPRVMGDHERD